MHMRERPYGGWLWILDMVTHEVSGFLGRSMGFMGLGLGKILGEAGESFLVTLDLRWVMAPKIDFGMMRGEGIIASRLFFRTYSVLPHLRKLPWHTIWISSVSHQWNVNFLRAAHNWEVDLFTSFFNLLYSLRLGQW